MGFLGSIGKGIVNAVTSPVRVVTNGLKTIGNAALCVKDILTLNPTALKQDAGNMFKSGLKTAFAGVESVLTYGTFGVGGIALGGMRGAATSAIVDGAASIGINTTARSLGASFLTGMLEPK